MEPRLLELIVGRVVTEARAVLAADRMEAPLDPLDAALARETTGRSSGAPAPVLGCDCSRCVERGRGA